jgi:hypothetical protein
VNSINSKLETGDSLYNEDIFGEYYDRVKEVEVVPVIDVYELVNKSEENKETFELLLDEFGDISFLEDEININEYPTHKIKIYIKGQADNEMISNRLYDHLASNPYYNELKVSTLENLGEQLIENKRIRQQIDSIVKENKTNIGFSNDEKNSINFSGSQNLKELLDQKRILLRYDIQIQEQLTSEDEVLKIIDSSFGIYDAERTSSFLKIPVGLVGLYCLVFFFMYLKRSVDNFVKKD